MDIVRRGAVVMMALALSVLVAAPVKADTDDVGIQATYYSSGISEAATDDAGGINAYASLRVVGSPPDSWAPFAIQFLAYGEWVEVQDNVVDGLVPVGWVKPDGGEWKSYTGDQKVNLSYAEGRGVSVKVCIKGASTCSKVYKGRA